MNGISLFSQNLPLSDTETMLFIGNDKRQLMIDCFFLYQRVRSNDDIRFTIRYLRINRFTLFGRCRTGKQNRCNPQRILFFQLQKRFIMLSCQHFRRSHHRTLTAVAGTHQKGEKSKNCFSRTDISLYQPAHDRIAAKVLSDFRPDLLLGIGELIGKRFDQPLRIISFYHFVSIG